MSKYLAKGLPTRKQRIRSELDMAVNYLGIVFTHLKNVEDMAGQELVQLKINVVGYSDDISEMLKGDMQKPGLTYILEDLKDKIKAEESE